MDLDCRLVDLAKRNPLKYIRHPRLGVIPLRPYRKQAAFIENCLTPGVKVSGWDGPNRAGKTMAASMVCVSRLTGVPLDAWPDLADVLPDRPPGRPIAGGCITISWPKSRDVQQRALGERLPKKWIQGRPWDEKTGFGRYGPKLVLKNGSTVDFLSDFQRHQGLEGFLWDWAWIDEAVDEWVYERLIARLVDTGGQLIVTAVAEKPWLYRVLRCRLMTYQDVEPASADLIRTIADSTMFDNELLDRASIEQSIALWGGIDSAEARMRVKGEYTHLEGVVVWTFNETDSRHVKRTREPPADWTRYEYADPGFDRPFAWGFAAAGPNGEKEIYDEIYERHMLVPDLAKRIKLKREQHGYAEPRFAVIDPAADQKSHWGRATMSIRAELAACGIRTVAADNSPGSVDAGFERIRSQFSAGYLAIQEHCRWHRFELLNHRFKESARPGGDVGGDKYTDKDNHLLAGLRYALGTGLVYLPLPATPPPRGTAAADLLELERQRAAETRRDRRRSGRAMH